MSAGVRGKGEHRTPIMANACHRISRFTFFLRLPTNPGGSLQNCYTLRTGYLAVTLRSSKEKKQQVVSEWLKQVRVLGVRGKKEKHTTVRKPPFLTKRTPVSNTQCPNPPEVHHPGHGHRLLLAFSFTVTKSALSNQKLQISLYHRR